MDSSSDMGGEDSGGGGGVGGSGGWNGGGGGVDWCGTKWFEAGAGAAGVEMAGTGDGGSGGAGGVETVSSGSAAALGTRNGGIGSWFGSGDDWNADHAHFPDDDASAFCFCCPPLLAAWLLLAELERFRLRLLDPLSVLPLLPVAAPFWLEFVWALVVPDRSFDRRDPRLFELLRGAPPFPTASQYQTHVSTVSAS